MMHQEVQPDSEEDELLTVTRLSDDEPIVHEEENEQAWICGFVEVPR